ncbi:Helix-turn-helix domain-containing protein [Nocardia amikacinitolerans]|uniref:Helix-turn-helix domain-containing protein n=1 Tax=Nocardia amikacinitolerans TaxID=756689 RepID=A0A285KY71_9NOCA|nr:helix-turn-helix transcriptional regulator [Nocardia amikacinitolerans]MCP2276224.1 Helix-turn-helix domain-containing protein [Nocardia amikacinitolerans]SNY77600.1 Helix-turn-helix domain-containing protein [Nocardia amikacinitolerans]
MTERAPHLRELGGFLKARRAELSPEEVGLSVHSAAARRVAGLRREEVADLAAISHDYYTRIEQGRLAPSEPVLEALVRILRLDDAQRDYAENLARRFDRRPAKRGQKSVRPQLQRLLDQLTETPALVFGRYLDILAWNHLAAALITDFGQMTPRQRNYVRMVFTDPAMRTLYDDWESVARTCVAILRMDAATNPTDPQLTALVGELSIADEQFRQWWAARNVARQEFGSKTLHHPDVGEMTLNWDTFSSTSDSEQQLVLWSAEPGTTSHEKLRILTSWSAPVPHQDAAHHPN